MHPKADKMNYVPEVIAVEDFVAGALGCVGVDSIWCWSAGDWTGVSRSPASTSI